MLTSSEASERARAAGRWARAAAAWAAAWRWTPVIALALLAGWLVFKLDAGRRSAGEVARLAEEARLRAEGVSVAWQKKARDLALDLEAGSAREAAFAAEVKRLKKAAPDARPVAVIAASSGPLDADPAAAPARPASPSGDTVTAAAGSACLFYASDKGQIRAEQGLLETDKGNVLYAGAGSCFRLDPPEQPGGEPRAVRLFGGPLRAELSVEKVAGAPGWGFGAAGSMGSGGATAGLAVALPPARAWSWQLETTLTGEASPSALSGSKDGGAEWRAGATAVIRRWR